MARGWGDEILDELRAAPPTKGNGRVPIKASTVPATPEGWGDEILKELGYQPPEPEPGVFDIIGENLGRMGREPADLAGAGVELLGKAGKPAADIILHPTTPERDLGYRVVEGIKSRIPKHGDLEMPDLAGTEFEEPEVPEEGKAWIPFGGKHVSVPSRKKKGEWELRKEYNPIEESVRAWTRGSLELAESLGTGVRGLGTALEYVAPHTGAEVQQLGKDVETFWGRYAKEYEGSPSVEGAIAEEPGLLVDPKWWAQGVFSTLPSLVASMVVGMGIGRAIEIGGKMFKWTPKLVEKLAHLGAAITGGAVGGSIEGAQTYRQVIERGGTEQEALRAGTLMALASGILNALSLERILPKGAAGKLSRGAASRLGGLKKTLMDAGMEGITEWLEEPAEAIILGDPVLDAMREGLNVIPPAALLGGLAGAAGRARIRQRAPASFVGYDQTANGPMPIFVLDKDLGEAKKGSFVTGATLADAGFTVPKYPSPKSGEKLIPDETQIETDEEGVGGEPMFPEGKAEAAVIDKILDDLAGEGGIPVGGGGATGMPPSPARSSR